jgi:hypothetical protein
MSPSRTDSIGADDQALPSPTQEEAQLSAPPSIIVSEQHDDDQKQQEPSADGSSSSHPIELSD